MNVILYMALSLDGYIVGPNDDTTWVFELEYKASVDLPAKLAVPFMDVEPMTLVLKKTFLPLPEP